MSQPDGTTPASNARLVGRAVTAAKAVGSASPVAGLIAYGATAAAWFAAVLPRSTWDYKRRGGTDAMGNVNYGATGAALGVPTDILLRAAGAVQGPNPENRGRWTDTGNSSYGDQPRDQQDIKKGVTCAVR